ncbi:MAG: fumarylacetoacetate hydrolase family protein [Acidobacteria bacterium]|nr:fumarylacetoacetate hydrolase family protein [Acidobacteriota bacterium]
MTPLAAELLAAYADRRLVTPPSARDAAFDLAAAYAVEAEIAQVRRDSGHQTVGWKVGSANPDNWAALKLDTVTWAHLYDDTVRYADWNDATLSIASMLSPKIEPEIVFKLARPPASGDAVAVLKATEWIALGFEIIDCVFPGWKAQPADFVAARGVHAALVIGEPVYVEPDEIAKRAGELADFSVRLLKNNELVAEGVGASVFKSPALCVGELAAAMKRRGGETLQAGDVITTGSLTTAMPIAPGDTWIASLSGIPPSALTLRVK